MQCSKPSYVNYSSALNHLASIPPMLHSINSRFSRISVSVQCSFMRTHLRDANLNLHLFPSVLLSALFWGVDKHKSSLYDVTGLSAVLWRDTRKMPTRKFALAFRLYNRCCCRLLVFFSVEKHKSSLRDAARESFENVGNWQDVGAATNSREEKKRRRDKTIGDGAEGQRQEHWRRS